MKKKKKKKRDWKGNKSTVLFHHLLPPIALAEQAVAMTKLQLYCLLV